MHGPPTRPQLSSPKAIGHLRKLDQLGDSLDVPKPGENSRLHNRIIKTYVEMRYVFSC